MGKPYTILDVVQGSEEWKALRYDYTTASQVPDLFGLGYRTKLQLAEEKISRKEPDMSGKEHLFEHAHRVEAAAREWVKAKLGLNVVPMVLTSHKCPDLLASLDGIDQERAIGFEAKYIGRDALHELKKGVVKPAHEYQVQAQLLASGADKFVYFAMDPSGEAAYTEILPNLETQNQIASEVTQFMTDIRAGKFPEPSDKDVILLDDPMFLELARIDAEVTRLKTIYDGMEASLLEKYEKHARFKSGPVSVTRYWAKGSVDYGKVPQLKGVDLERFRKAGGFRTKVTIKGGA